MNRKVSPQIHDSDLSNLARDALAAYQAKGEVALAGGFIVGAGLSNEHARHASGKSGEKPEKSGYHVNIMAQQNEIPTGLKSQPYVNQRVAEKCC